MFVQGGSEINVPTGKKQFLCNQRSFYITISGFIEERFINSPWKFLWKRVISSKTTAGELVYSLFWNFAEEKIVACYVPDPLTSSFIKNWNICLSLSKSMFKVSTANFQTSSNSFCENPMALLIETWGSWSHNYYLQDMLQLFDVLWLRMKCLVVFKHTCSSPDLSIKRIKVWWVWWPFIFVSEFTTVGGNKVLYEPTLPCEQLHCPAGMKSGR